MADFTATTVATWMPAIWSARPTITYRSNTVIVKTLDHSWESAIGMGKGNRVNIPGFTQNNSAKNRGAGTGTFGTGATTTFDAVTEAQLVLTVNRYYYKAWRYPYELAPQFLSEYPGYILDGAAKACALQVDADCASDATNGLASSTTTVGVDNVDVTEDDIITCETNLNNNNAPSDGRWLIISPATRGSMIKIEAFRNSLYQGAIGNLDGKVGLDELGRVLTFRTVVSNNLAAGLAGKKNAAFHTEYITYAEQLNLQNIKTLNTQDGGFDQYITFMTNGFLKVKDIFSNLLAAK